MLKSYEKLTFSDSYLFTKILYNHLDICKDILELLLNKKIRSLRQVVPEKTVDNRIDAKGVRFDVFTEEDAGAAYDVEMQVLYHANLPKRARYYSSMIDLDLLRKGEDYGSLKDSYVIFICKDGVGEALDKPIYTYTYRCEEESGLALNDGSRIVFVNAACRENGISNELKSFLQYVSDGKTSYETELTKRLEEEVRLAVRKDDWRRDYMTLYEWMNDERKEAREEGRAEGRAEGAAQKVFYRRKRRL